MSSFTGNLLRVNCLAGTAIVCGLAAVWGAPAYAQGGPLPPAAVTVTPDTPPAGVTNQSLGNTTRFIRVTGYGVARVKPGDAIITFLVSTSDATGQGALQNNQDRVTHVIKGLQAGGVPQDNITRGENILVNIPPPPPAAANAAGAAGNGAETPVDTGNTGGTGSPEGVPAPPPPAAPEMHYTANARVQVITHEVADVSGIEQIGMYAGAKGVLDIRLEARNIPDLKQQALIAALKDAANKAEILALGVKVRVLYAISVSELPVSAPEPAGAGAAPLTEITMPMSIEVVYAVG